MSIWLVYLGLLAWLMLAWLAVTWTHELGHAVVGRVLSGGPVSVFVGSYGGASFQRHAKISTAQLARVAGASPRYRRWAWRLLPGP